MTVDNDITDMPEYKVSVLHATDFAAGSGPILRLYLGLLHLSFTSLFKWNCRDIGVCSILLDYDGTEVCSSAGLRRLPSSWCAGPLLQRIGYMEPLIAQTRQSNKMQ